MTDVRDAILRRLQGEAAGTNHNVIALRDGQLGVTCWCERAYVYVPVRDVRAGRTLACDDDRCGPPT